MALAAALILTKSTPPNYRICSKVVKNSSKPMLVDRSNEYKSSPLTSGLSLTKST
jgi:hypothetical protein